VSHFEIIVVVCSSYVVQRLSVVDLYLQTMTTCNDMQNRKGRIDSTMYIPTFGSVRTQRML
jgi:hypothetical protein